MTTTTKRPDLPPDWKQDQAETTRIRPRPDGGELKPCPFCGTANLKPQESWKWSMVQRFVYCEPCGARSPNFGEFADAVKWWNTRTPTNESPAPQAELEQRIFDALPAKGDDKVPWSWQDTLALAEKSCGVDAEMAKSQVAEVRRIAAAVAPAPQPPVEGLRALEIIDGYILDARSSKASFADNKAISIQCDAVIAALRNVRDDIAALASPSLTAERPLVPVRVPDEDSASGYRIEWTPAPATLIEQSGQKSRERG